MEEAVMCRNESRKSSGTCVRGRQTQRGGCVRVQAVQCVCCALSSHLLMSLLQMGLPLSARCPPPSPATPLSILHPFTPWGA